MNPQTAPCFIVHTHEDAIVPASQATLIYDALLRAGVKAELHIFNDGEHGVGLAAGDPDVAEWPKLLLRWLRRRGLLAHEERCAVRGSVLCAEQPLGLGWLTLIPKHAQHPIARTFLHKREGGDFSLRKTVRSLGSILCKSIDRQQAQYDGSRRYGLERSLMNALRHRCRPAPGHQAQARDFGKDPRALSNFVQASSCPRRANP